MDPDVVAGRALDPDVVAGRVRRDVDWKGWKGRQLEGLEGMLIGSGRWIRKGTGRDVGSGWGFEGHWIQMLLLEGDWMGRRIRMGIGSDVVAGWVGRDVGSGRC